MTYGQIAFEAYRTQMNGRTYDGKPIPQWHELHADVQTGWMVAAAAVVNTVAQAFIEHVKSKAQNA